MSLSVQNCAPLSRATPTEPQRIQTAITINYDDNVRVVMHPIYEKGQKLGYNVGLPDWQSACRPVSIEDRKRRFAQVVAAAHPTATASGVSSLVSELGMQEKKFVQGVPHHGFFSDLFADVAFFLPQNPK